MCSLALPRRDCIRRHLRASMSTTLMHQPHTLAWVQWRCGVVELGCSRNVHHRQFSICAARSGTAPFWTQGPGHGQLRGQRRRLGPIMSMLPDNLEALSYRELQSLAKQNGLKANQKGENILAELRRISTSTPAVAQHTADGDQQQATGEPAVLDDMLGAPVTPRPLTQRRKGQLSQEKEFDQLMRQVERGGKLPAGWKVYSLDDDSFLTDKKAAKDAKRAWSARAGEEDTAEGPVVTRSPLSSQKTKPAGKSAVPPVRTADPKRESWEAAKRKVLTDVLSGDFDDPDIGAFDLPKPKKVRAPAAADSQRLSKAKPAPAERLKPPSADLIQPASAALPSIGIAAQPEVEGAADKLGASENVPQALAAQPDRTRKGDEEDLEEYLSPEAMARVLQLEAELEERESKSKGASAREQAARLRQQEQEEADEEAMLERLRAAMREGVDDSGLEGASAAAYGWDENEQPALKPYTIAADPGSCPGCGATFQKADAAVPGYLPPEVLDSLTSGVKVEKVVKYKSRTQFELDYLKNAAAEEGIPLESDEEETVTICQRCHRLRRYGQVDDNLRIGMSSNELLTPQRFQELLKVLRDTKCLVVYLVDLFDFHGSFLYNLPQIVGDNPVILAANKADLLPGDMIKDRVKLWVRNEARQRGLRGLEMRDISLVSCRTGYGVANLLRKAREGALERDCDIYVIGAANVGKSTLINHILEKTAPKRPWGKEDNGKGRVKGRKGHTRSDKNKGLTVSNVPGTTLDFLRIDLGEKRFLYDTPGLIMPHQLTSRLNSDELRAVIPQKQIEHVTLRIAEGKTMLVGGLAQVSLVEGRPFFFTFFVGNEVKLHLTDMERASDYVERHMGKLIFPPWSLERRQAIGEMVTTSFTIDGCGWEEACVDIVLSGLGWVAVTGVGRIKVEVTVPKNVLVMLRPPLMPYEARDTTASYTGAKIVKKSRKIQGRRA